MADDDDTATLLAGRYRLDDLIGRGGMGEVRGARDLTLGRDVAIKLLHPGLASDERVSRRFQHEAWAAARLTHPNVVRVYDAGVHDGRPFIVMERLDGGTLADEIARGPLSEARARLVGSQMLDALCAAHDNGVLHRDVKPSNVMRAPDGSVRVGDFGIAKTDLATDGTTTGTVVGTLGYLAPERLEGRPATASSDCYSVAVVLYEALTGQRPFTGDSPVAVLASVQRAEPTSLAELRPDVDVALRDTITVAMSPDPRDRFASAREFAAAVRGEAKPPRRVPPTVRTAAVTPAPSPDPTAVFVAPVEPADRPVAPLRPPMPPPPPPAPVTSRVGAAAPRAKKPGVRGGKLLMLFVVLIALGAALGVGIGVLLRDDPSSDGAPPATGDPVEDALRGLEEAITP